MAVAPWVVSDELRKLVEPLLPKKQRRLRYPGRKRLPDRHRRLLRERGITPLIARRQPEHGSGLGRVRWVVERTSAHLHNFKRLLVRYERRADNARGPARSRLLPHLLPPTRELNLK